MADEIIDQERRVFLGRSAVSLYGLGGLFTVSMPDHHDEAVEIVDRAIDLGVSYIDTSASQSGALTGPASTSLG